jgi:hypothetical protein
MDEQHPVPLVPHGSFRPCHLFSAGGVSYRGRRFYVDAEDCRAEARELREKVRTTKDPSARAHLLVMAEQYDWLARQAEAEKRESETP